MPGLSTTFDILANTANDTSAAVLVTALDASQREVRDLAITALLARRNAAAELHILRRWSDLSQRWKQQVADRPGWLSEAIRAAIVNRDPNLYECACEAAVYTRDYDSIPVLVAAASDPTNPAAARVAAATLELTELLAEELSAPRDYRIRRDPQLQRDHVLVSLEKVLTTPGLHWRRELLEAFMLLAIRDNAALKRMLQSPTDRIGMAVIEQLTFNTRPGIERLLLSYLDDPHAPLSAVQTIGKRGDISFIRQVARKVGAEPTPVVRTNLHRIDALPWVAQNVSILDALREGEQAGIVHLAVESSAPRATALQVVDYIARHGKLEGRRIAAKTLVDLHGPAANELVLHLQKDEDPEVRAAAARQLRSRNIPGAIQQLLTLLESPHDAEREAAREGLAEFTLERFSSNYDQMTPQARTVAGSLVRRVDSQLIEKLGTELTATARSRRKRALELCVALDAVGTLQESIAAAVKDEDQYVRIEAIRVLARVDSQMARQSLRDALLDPLP
ncbi:MAG: HEAT repeat domain-containing protein, partial [Planctomycetia bacterium]|nr:HEAT repeat domain-containing protein [Planctomycetia bacterium]